MGQLAVPALMAASLFDASSKFKAGRAQANDLKVQRREEKAAGRDAQIRRNEELLNDLARRRAVAAASGGGPGGSLAAAERRQGELAEQDIAAINAMTSSRVRRLRSQGQAAKRQGTLGAISSIIGGGAKASLLSG